MADTKRDILPETVEEEAPEEADEEQRDGFVEFLKELPVLIVVAFGLALLIKTFLIQAFFIPSGSMEPTLQEGDRVFVSKLSYRFGEPERGDVVVFVSPTGPIGSDEGRGPVGRFFDWLREGMGLKSSETDFIKRVVAIEGQSVEGRGGDVFVDGERLEEPYVKQSAPIADFGPVEVGTDEIFVMGDFRTNSTDSRDFGAVEESTIVGRAWVLIWPPDRISLLD
jgi:signal peptidase I